jgi:hypothetical protein
MKGTKMPFINVGAYVDGVRPKTKKALKEACANDPNRTRVVFDGTALNNEGHRYTLDHPNDTLQVCGPDPYTKRNWYASVKNGKVT